MIVDSFCEVREIVFRIAARAEIEEYQTQERRMRGQQDEGTAG
jgi:hypothetical protein